MCCSMYGAHRTHILMGEINRCIMITCHVTIKVLKKGRRQRWKEGIKFYTDMSEWD